MGPEGRLTILSLDGVPHGLLLRLMDQGHMPALARMCEKHGRPRTMRSVLPTVSCVAWASFATGRNPGKHGIYGFVDRKPGSYEMRLPNGAAMHGPNLWEILSRAGKRVFGMNVPSTYPPRPVNGVLIGGFLAPSLAKAAYPPEVASYLRGIDYRIDSDAAVARESKERMLKELHVTLARRAKAMFHFLDQEEWDFFHTHIMGTDRINHFLLRTAEQGDPKFAPAFAEYYRAVDSVIARLLDRLGRAAPLIIFSDHGFCPIRHEVQLARCLVERGWTTPAARVVGPFSFDPTRSKAYCLIPGRIYVNLRGREAEGCVRPEDYEQVRQAVADDLLRLRDPQDRPVIRTALKREELYWPAGRRGPGEPVDPTAALLPYSMAPDLIAHPHDGFDLKMGLNSPAIFVDTELEGMHTYHDALCLARGVNLPEGDLEIRQLAGAVLETLGVPADDDMDLEPVPEPAGILA